jgi:hypothetical protein
VNWFFVARVAAKTSPLWSFVVTYTICAGMLSLGLSYVEGFSLANSFYIVWVSIGTIGYGDLHPTNDSGRLFSILCGMFNFVFIGFFINLLRNYLTLMDMENSVTVWMKYVGLSKHSRRFASECIASTVELRHGDIRSGRLRRSNAQDTPQQTATDVPEPRDCSSCTASSRTLLAYNAISSWSAHHRQLKRVSNEINKLLKSCELGPEDMRASETSANDGGGKEDVSSASSAVFAWHEQRLERLERKSRHIVYLLNRLEQCADP